VKPLIFILGGVALVVLTCVGVGIGGLVYSVSRVREAASKMKTQNNFKQVGLALHNYESANATFPPAALKTKDGSPGLSWRVAILPYLEADSLYKQFKLDEGWQHPDNMRLAAQMPNVFAEPSEPKGDKTHMRVFVGPRTIFDPAKPMRGLFSIQDGSSNTLMVVETSNPVLWIQPDELPFGPSQPLPSLGLPNRDGFTALYADGSVRWIRKSVSAEKLKLLIDTEDGQIVDIDN